MARWFLVLLTGCSLSLSGPDPNRPRSKAPVCDTSKSLVVLDGLLAATMGVIAVATASNNDGGAAVAPALFGALFVASAIHGNNVVNDCHREMENYDQTMAARDAVPPPRPMLAPPSAVPPEVPPQPEPQVAPPQPVPAPPPVQQTPPAPSGDRWQAFWREVP